MFSPTRIEDILCSTPIKSGRSKDIFRVDDRQCLVRLKPSLRSYTFKRDEDVIGTDTLRLDFFEIAAQKLRANGVPCAFLERISCDTYLAELCEDPPFETIVKNRAIGSTLRLYPGLFPEGFEFRDAIVKFDFRTDPEDQAIGDDYVAAAGHDPTIFKHLARKTNNILQNWLAPRELWDFCIIIGRNSKGEYTIISEISPDCMRLRTPEGSSLDKDLFRLGADRESIISTWSNLIAELRSSL